MYRLQNLCREMSEEDYFISNTKNAGVKYITPVFLLLKLNGFTDTGTVVDFAIVCHKDGFRIVRILD